MIEEQTRQVVEEAPERYSPPGPSERVERAPGRRGTRGVMMAVLLIGLGVAMLLDNLQVINLDWWALLRYWPALLILIGLDVMLGNRSILASVAVAVVGLAVVSGVLFFGAVQQTGFGPSGDTITRPLTQKIQGAESLEVELRLGASETTVRSMADEGLAVRGEYTTDENLSLVPQYEVRSDTGYLSLSQESRWFEGDRAPFLGELDLWLTNLVPIALTVDPGMGDVTLDLTGLQLTSLDINGGFGNLELILPGEGVYTVSINGGVGDIDMTVPAGLGVSISMDGGLGDIDVSAEGVEEIEDNRWESPGFDNAEHQATIDLNGGIGSVSIDD